jgi:hypothetical protein
MARHSATHNLLCNTHSQSHHKPGRYLKCGNSNQKYGDYSTWAEGQRSMSRELSLTFQSFKGPHIAYFGTGAEAYTITFRKKLYS